MTIVLSDEQKAAVADLSLTSEQDEALWEVVNGIARGQKEWRIGGFAGSGKTHVLKAFKAIFPHYAVCAYTGAATDVLRRRGLPASTIHSLIYYPQKDDRGVVRFVKLLGIGYAGIMVDEASMVTHPIYQDLLSFGLPLIFLGDHGQLPPITRPGERPFNLMDRPDFRFETLHRNAGEVAHFAQHLRRGEPSHQFRPPVDLEQQVHFLRREHVTGELLAKLDITICAYNRTRVELNRQARQYLGYDDVLVPNDRVVVLKNHSGYGVFNGQKGVVREVDWSNGSLTFVDGDRIYHEIPFDVEQFGQERLLEGRYDYHGPVPFDYAYASTAHKIQGDQRNKVGVVEQDVSRICEQRRWNYTAASRAIRYLFWQPARGW